MNSDALLAPYFARVESCPALRWQGRVTQVVGPLVELVLLQLKVCEQHAHDAREGRGEERELGVWIRGALH